MRILSSTFALLAVPASAFFGSSSQGQGEFAFLSQHVSARSAALQGSGALNFGDAGALFSNPAALLQESGQKRTLALSANSDPMGGSVGNAAYLVGDTAFTYGIGAAWTDYGSIQAMTEDGEPDLETGRFRPGNFTASLSAAFPTRHLRWGFTGRFISENLGDVEGARLAMGWGLDWGAIYRPSSPLWVLGFSVLDLGGKVTSHVNGGDQYGSLNTTLRSDLTLRSPSIPRLRTHAALEAPRYDPARLRLGLEYSLSSALTLRGGTRADLPQIWRGGRRLFGSDISSYQGGNIEVASGGVGLLVGIVQFDYAAVLLSDQQGFRHHFGLSAKF